MIRSSICGWLQPVRLNPKTVHIDASTTILINLDIRCSWSPIEYTIIIMSFIVYIDEDVINTYTVCMSGKRKMLFDAKKLLKHCKCLRQHKCAWRYTLANKVVLQHFTSRWGFNADLNLFAIFAILNKLKEEGFWWSTNFWLIWNQFPNSI